MKALLLKFSGGLLLAAIVCTAFATIAHAATFVVNTTDDGNDLNPGDGVCEVTINTNDCGLRALIQETNALGGTNAGNVNISGPVVHTFTPASVYPTITNSLTIDGVTNQEGASCGTLVPASLPANTNTPHTLLAEINGMNTVGSILNFSGASASNSVVRGLIIAGNPTGTAINGNSSNNLLIECNYFGTNSVGTTTVSNNSTNIEVYDITAITIQNNLISGSSNGYGINVGSNYNPGTALIQNNLIGTNATGTGNLGNNGVGISVNNVSGWTISHNVVANNNSNGIDVSNSNEMTITGNFIGVNMAGSLAGNAATGLSLFATYNFTVGGTTSSLRNVISANTADGLHIYNNCGGGFSMNSTIYGNYIGTNTNGAVQTGYGNQGAGIEVNEYQGSCGSVYRHQIGGDSAGQPNIIAGNAQQGILIHQDSNHDVFSIASIGNSVFSNGQFGIDLAADSGGDGVADTDLGPNAINTYLMSYAATNANYYINRPVINSTAINGNQLTVNYSLQANEVQDNAPSIKSSNLVGYRLDFYLNDSPGQDGDFTGYAQGKTHLGSFVVNGSESNAIHTFTSPVTLANGQTVTATTTALWQVIPDPGTNCQDDQWGVGPPYNTTCNN